MKARSLMMLLFMGAVVSSFGQKKVYTSEKAGDNIFVSATGGISIIHNGDETKFGDVTPHVTLSLGKWINPVWGFRGQAGAWKANFDAKTAHGCTKNYDKNIGILRLDGMFNLSNAIFGYNPDRLFNLIGFAGPGLTIAKGAKAVEDADEIKAYPNVSGGLLAKFNVSKHFDIDIEGRADLASAYLGYHNHSNRVAGLYLGAGLTYTFGKGKYFAPYVAQSELDALNDQVNGMRRDLEQAQADLAAANEKIANFKPEVQQVVTKEVVVGPRAVFFRIGSARIDDYGKVNIKLIADIIKSNSDKKFKVAGYADKATGSAAFNQKLSEKRAKAVYDLLVKEGVSESQLEMVAEGGTANMFDKNKLNRVVILGE